MQNNASKRIGLSIQGIGMAWCICRKIDGKYIVEEFKTMSTSLSQLKRILTDSTPIYTNQENILRHHNLRFVGTPIHNVKTTRDDVESLIASAFNEGEIQIGESSSALIKKVMREDYLIRELETPAAQALHFGLGQLIYDTTQPLAYSVTPLVRQIAEENRRKLHINFGSNAEPEPQQSPGMISTNQIRMLYYDGFITFQEMEARLRKAGLMS